MSLLKLLCKTRGAVDTSGVARFWILYFNAKDEIIEVKSLYNPEEYKGARVVYNDDEIIEKLNKYKNR